MSKKNLARRTRIRLEFESADISEEIERDLLSFQYTDTDGSEEKADDLQITLDDSDGKWLEYLDNPKHPSNKNHSDFNVGDKVTVTGTPQYTSYGEFTAGVPVSNYHGTVTLINDGAPYPIHVDQLGWFKKEEIVLGESAPDNMTSKAGSKGALLHAFIIQENWHDKSIIMQKTATKKESTGSWAVGDKVTATGTPQYTSYGEFTPGTPVSGHQGVITYLNIGAPYPIHVDHLGWFAEAEVSKEGEEKVPSQEKGITVSLSGRDSILDCGTFELDTVNFAGPPQTVTIKATSVPNVGNISAEEKTRFWINISLKEIAAEMAGNASFKIMYLASKNPFYPRREQTNMSDIVFLSRLAANSGISMKVTSRTIVLYNSAEFEQKDSVRVIDLKKGDVLNWQFSTSLVDTVYKDCNVKYTDPATGETKTHTYTPTESDEKGPTLTVKEKVSTASEAEELAKKSLRSKKEGEFAGTLTLLGDTGLLAGVTINLENFKLFDGKYIVETANHKVTTGYQTVLEVRQTLDFD